MATLAKCGRLFFTKTVKLGHVFKYTPATNLIAARKFSQTSSLLADKKYSEKHEWVTLEGNIGTVGISQYAQDSLGDIVYVQLPEVDDEFDQDDECGALESVKAASEIYSPLTGKITAKNEKVEETPGLINKSPYDDGWLFKIELSNIEEMDGLMDQAAYEKFLKSQEE